ncbi:hypothetical protein A3A76_03140 [Candidatus Woesebacteria bacterium RIFCSPLOWO2_01_FULL_39_23]|uniref:DNA polymerase III delta N-terminal domain-containing protein n=1 Tax=Candidatus Woesebacteria bacterium RIFCSPHIGHO2_01_FULL_40_22 TaxID=1802499 RepID=A0A1F7YJE2_9BACT|nr:MAG: hypothetical protein A2141_00885 [Candidatus Woesebacteria bacterium RBG_16_40_11]OGM27456.1 MAG: hypothetical protein A2628_01540 [Candidatus Woesebacteria bacterium RIFCSPHIGHO2_01_FULL_40_22]OGM36586.1 MAG: hypothetical protein A3E41_04105 [Candidatus Woesebacteria bacterium RIFCSPHIGHO2_12_FULL_38_9]OGM62630.1 MAG: hypothetical protein A3A76_03140 [Candidatus Woesebacteria bacterium RIFCSPLOWO2_01_FULL_39_23]
MHIILIHGDNTIESYTRLQTLLGKAKDKGWEIEKIDNKNQNVKEALVSQGLFNTKRLVLVESSSLINKDDVIWVKKNKDLEERMLLIYSDSPITKTVLNSFPEGSKVEEFKLPVYIWRLLDSFYPGNSLNILKLLHSSVSNMPIEFIFSLLAKLMRDFYWVKLEPSSIPYQDWRVSKLKNQASKFSVKKITEIISKLAKIDVKVKKSEAELLPSLDLLIIKYLE